MAHSPGPWAIVETDTRLAIKSGKHTVAYVQMARDDLENAALIAAAPKLLAILKELIEWDENSRAEAPSLFNKIIPAARAAIRKAEAA